MIANLYASALKSGAKVILSEDMNSGQTIAGIRIENPFIEHFSLGGRISRKPDESAATRTLGSMTKPALHSFTSKRSFIAAATLIAAFAAIASKAAHAQTPGPAATTRPAFAVASIRPSNPSASPRMMANFTNGNFQASNITLTLLIRLAYDLNEDQLSGGPAWLASTRFDIAAKPDGQTTQPGEAVADRNKLMLQQLLADRFELQLQHETKQVPGYALSIAKKGAKGLLPNSSGNRKLEIGSGELTATGVSLDDLAYALSRRVTQRPVVNLTGLTGKYDFKLTWTLEQPPPSAPGAPAQQPVAPEDLAATISSALQDQLGLKLEAHKTDADFVVVKTVQLPSAN